MDNLIVKMTIIQIHYNKQNKKNSGLMFNSQIKLAYFNIKIIQLYIIIIMINNKYKLNK